MTLVLLIAGSSMGAGAGDTPVTYFAPIGPKTGVERPTAPDINMPTGVTGSP